MPTERVKKSESEITIRFRRDPDMGLTWSVVGDIPQRLTIMGAGYESALALLDDGDFLETLAWGLGNGSIPEKVLSAAKERDKKRRLPIPDELTATLEAAFPGKVKKRPRGTPGAA